MAFVKAAVVYDDEGKANFRGVVECGMVPPPPPPQKKPLHDVAHPTVNADSAP